MKISILTLFPEYFSNIFEVSMLAKAQQKNKFSYQVINIRDFASNKHKTTDDRPYGGGAGMVLKIEPIYQALLELKLLSQEKIQGLSSSHLQDLKATNLRNQNDGALVLLTSAKGEVFTQKNAGEYSKNQHLVIICGHYEGVDERVAKYLVDAEVSIGEFVLTGGEPACSVIVDSVVRLIPGVLNNSDSLREESHNTLGVAEHPQYTRPENFLGMAVPKTLLSGDHAKIKKWQSSNQEIIN
jgi:tRNA (guanine37-N1)-methyltransferase